MGLKNEYLSPEESEGNPKGSKMKRKARWELGMLLDPHGKHRRTSLKVLGTCICP